MPTPAKATRSLIVQSTEVVQDSTNMMLATYNADPGSFDALTHAQASQLWPDGLVSKHGTQLAQLYSFEQRFATIMVHRIVFEIEIVRAWLTFAGQNANGPACNTNNVSESCKQQMQRPTIPLSTPSTHHQPHHPPQPSKHPTQHLPQRQP